MSVTFDELSRPNNPIPGVRGLPGSAGAVGATGPAGSNAFTATTSAYTQPATGSSVTVAVTSSAFAGVGQAIFVEGGGYYVVASLPGGTSMSLTRQAISGSYAATSGTVNSGSKVSPGGFAAIDNSQYTTLAARTTALETATALQTYYTGTAPTGTIVTGSLWFDTANNYRMSRWNGAAWVAIDFGVTLTSFPTDLSPVQVVSTLPVSGMVQGDLAFLTTDNKLYRYTGTAWVATLSGSDIIGTIDGTQLAANSIVAGKIAAGAITASLVGANQIITYAANIQDAVITSAKINDLAATKITAGTITSAIIQIAGGASGAIRSSNYSAGTSGWNIDGAGNAEFNAVTVRGTLAAGRVSNDSYIYNPATPASYFASSTSVSGVNSTPRSSLTLGGTTSVLCTFYGWASGTGLATNRFGKSSMVFLASTSGGYFVATSSYSDTEMVYRINGGSWTQINSIACRALDSDGGFAISGQVAISGLVGTDQIDFGVRHKAPNTTTSIIYVDMTVTAFNF